MAHLCIKMNLGIGDILFTKAVLDNVKENFESIKVAPNYELINQYRNGDTNYRDFIDGLFFLLFSEPPYEIVNDPSFPSKTPYDLYHSDGFCLCKPDLAKYLVDPYLYNGDRKGTYITVSTKVRGLKASDYVMKYRERFIESLQEISANYDLYIIGERKIGYNAEYMHHGEMIFCIYEDLKFHLENALDITVLELGETSPEIHKVIDDCSLMYNAKNNICFGIGGNFSLAACVGNLINFRATNGDAVDCASIIYKNENGDKVFSTDNFDLFIQKLGELNV